MLTTDQSMGKSPRHIPELFSFFNAYVRIEETQLLNIKIKGDTYRVLYMLETILGVDAEYHDYLTLDAFCYCLRIPFNSMKKHLSTLEELDALSRFACIPFIGEYRAKNFPVLH